MFGHKKTQPTEEHARTTEADVIAYVRELNDEEYKKLSKKFTLYRNLEKELRAIDDGDLENIAALDFEDMESRTGANNGQAG
jgi:hypothetical protein